MIITNGTLRIKTTTGGGLVDGKPTRPSEKLSDPIPCYVKTNQYNNRGKVEGNTFTVASYEILINDQPFDADTITLERGGKDLGEFSVQNIEPLEFAGAVKIIV